MNKTFGIIALSCMIIGCSSFPKYDPKHNTLIVGKIVENGQNYENYSGATVNGKHLSGITVTIENQETKTRYQLISQNNGIFISSNVPAGEYILKKFYLKVSFRGYSADIFTNPNGDKKFNIKDEAINNLGIIEWNCDGNEGIIYHLNLGYSEVKGTIENQYARSGWENKDWANLNCSK